MKNKLKELHDFTHKDLELSHYRQYMQEMESKDVEMRLKRID